MDLQTECNFVPMYPPELMQTISGLSVYHAIADYLIKNRRLTMENAMVLFQAVGRLDYFHHVVYPLIRDAADPEALFNARIRINKLIQDFEALGVDKNVFDDIKATLPHPATISLQPLKNESQ